MTHGGRAVLALALAVALGAACDSKVDLSSGGSGSTSSSSSSGSGPGTTTSAAGTATGTTTTGAISTASGAPLASGCMIVPLYAYPTDGTTWPDLAALASAHPSVEVVAIVNPDSGPGAAVDPTFTAGISALHAANVVVVGYVPTNYGMKTKGLVLQDIEDYGTFYPELDGIFFDEMSSDDAFLTRYQEYSTEAKQLVGTLTIGNPGTAVPIALLTTMDRVVVYENPGLPSLTDVAEATLDGTREKFALLPYEVPSFDAAFVAAAKVNARCIYITDDAEPNPWDSLPPYAEALVSALEP